MAWLRPLLEPETVLELPPGVCVCVCAGNRRTLNCAQHQAGHLSMMRTGLGQDYVLKLPLSIDLYIHEQQSIVVCTMPAETVFRFHECPESRHNTTRGKLEPALICKCAQIPDVRLPERKHMHAVPSFELLLVEAPAQALILAPTRELAVQIADMSRAAGVPEMHPFSVEKCVEWPSAPILLLAEGLRNVDGGSALLICLLRHLATETLADSFCKYGLTQGRQESRKART